MSDVEIDHLNGCVIFFCITPRVLRVDKFSDKAFSTHAAVPGESTWDAR